MLELSRAEILDRFRKSLDEGNILLGVGAGTGITAKSAEAGGAEYLRHLQLWSNSAWLAAALLQACFPTASKPDRC